MKNLIYSCVFFNENYIELINLLLKSYTLFGDPSENTDYLIICSPEFKDRIQETLHSLNLNEKIWCLTVTSKFESAYTRLKIFEYPEIHLYDKILYLDCDILITNSVDHLLNIELENKIYVLKEGGGRFYHYALFTEEEIESLDKNSAFSSGILLFNNNDTIKNLFSLILLHIKFHLSHELVIPQWLDQPFIVYHAIKHNLYNNTTFENLVINNPSLFKGEIISHFCGVPGHYESKIYKMCHFMHTVMFNQDVDKFKKGNGLNHLTHKKYKWEKSCILFLENGKMNAFGEGKYNFINKYLVKCDFGRRVHLLKFNSDYSTFISVRKDDFEVVRGHSLL